MCTVLLVDAFACGSFACVSIRGLQLGGFELDLVGSALNQAALISDGAEGQ